MNNGDFEFMLFDRIEKIKQINEEYDLENNSYISFSGGKDSTILHYLIDLALPNNKIPRLFINTGVEYQDIRKYVNELAINDDRIKIINSGINLKNMLKKYGYPFKSKQHSHNWTIYNNNRKECDKYINELFENNDKLKDYNFVHNLPNGVKTIVKYTFGVREKNEELYLSTHTAPKKLAFQFRKDYDGIKISDMCCYKLKKDPAHKWEKQNNKNIVMTGMRAEEGGMRNQNGCTIFEENKLKKFHPLKVVSEEWEDMFIKTYNIKLCKLYYPPYNFKRSGCKGCPFALDLKNQLEVMKKLLPNEYKQCEILWKAVYTEYRRIGYRLKKNKQNNQMSIFDFINME